MRATLLTLLTHRMLVVSVTRSVAGTSDASLVADRVLGKSSAGSAGTEDGSGGPGYIYGAMRYSLHVPAVLRRLRIPSHIATVRRAHGRAAAAVVEALLFHGPWTEEAVLARAAEVHVRARAADEAALAMAAARADQAEAAGQELREPALAVPEISSGAVARAYAECAEAWGALMAARLLLPETGLVAGGATHLQARGRVH